MTNDEFLAALHDGVKTASGSIRRCRIQPSPK
jgi:hypothetical protein